ncbi:hypothetical protein N7537_008627 [Penicillium hordei]|uniref:CENP-V/GFA domain-containing protein n=1 Tax=Penicillium hordei TaxID=40994 RepID=A0AAD6E1Y1_9EURO|nr:uncharacterized protein N7537_008627 [Penicillium hordei]KAJ5598543.1 hypothetical protein N7537_008627 [Penicillium hordei]
MAIGVCFCEKIRIRSTGEPVATGLCHCTDCRKLTGTLYTYSLIFKSAEIKTSGNPEKITKPAESGNIIENYFCSNCGTPLYAYKFPSGEWDSLVITRVGIFDDLDLLERKPAVELYVRSRAGDVLRSSGLVIKIAEFDGLIRWPEKKIKTKK